MKLVARLALGVALVAFAGTAVVMFALPEGTGGTRPQIEVRRPQHQRRRISSGDDEPLVIPPDLKKSAERRVEAEVREEAVKVAKKRILNRNYEGQRERNIFKKGQKVGMPLSKDIEPKRTPKAKKKEELIEMRKAGEPVYSGPTLPPLSPGDRGEVEADMESRRRRMRQVCMERGMDTAEAEERLGHDVGWEFMIAAGKKERKGLVWCHIFKSASSSWMRVFNRIAGYSEDYLRKSKNPPVSLARKHFPRPMKEELHSAMSNDSFTSFLIARHPFERFVSAYRDKIANSLRGSHHEKLGREMISKFGAAHGQYARANMSLRRARSERPSFATFADFVLDEFDSGRDLDMHWTPAFSFCDVCHVEFDLVLKFDTFSRDQRYLIERAGLQSYFGHPDNLSEGLNSGKSLTGMAGSGFVVDDFLEQLSPVTIKRLCELYKMDFLVFGFTHKKCD